MTGKQAISTHFSAIAYAINPTLKLTFPLKREALFKAAKGPGNFTSHAPDRCGTRTDTLQLQLSQVISISPYYKRLIKKALTNFIINLIL